MKYYTGGRSVEVTAHPNLVDKLLSRAEEEGF